MTNEPVWRRYQRFLRPDLISDVDDEIDFHIETRAAEYVAAGMTPAAARARAVEEFGDMGRAKRLCREIGERQRRRRGLVEHADSVRQDLRYGARMLARSPGFTAAAVLTLALGIASTTAIFSIVDAIVLRGLPYREPDRLRSVYERSDDGGLRVPSYPTFADWQVQAAPLADVIEGFAFVRGDGVNLPGADGPERRIAAYVTPGFFQLMGVRPRLGRSFSPDEERPGGARVAVISWELFRGRFGGDAATIGKTLSVDGVPTTIIGVMPHAFAYPNFGSGSAGRWLAPALWQPITVFQETHPQLSLRGLHADSRTVVRLKPGVDPARAAAAMRTIQQRLAAEYPVEQGHWTSARFEPLGEELYGDLPSALLLISGAIGLVLLLACANVANLFLVRGSVRIRELAVRAALGASRWRLARQLLTEALILASAAGAFGVVLASALVGFVRRATAERLPFAAELHVDTRIALFAAGISLATAFLVGVAPAVQTSAGDLMQRMRSGGAAAGSGGRERRLRHALVSVQVALALTLLIGAGLLLQSFRRLASVPLGYDPSGVIAFTIKPPSPRYDEPAQAAALYARILDAMRAVPGVSTAAAAGGALMPTPVQTDEPSTGRPPDQARYHPVSTEYLKTMRVALLAGRWFTEDDMRSPNGFVINQTLARQLWPGRSPLGRRITVRRSSQARADFGQPITLPVVGVVADMRQFGPAADPEPEVMLPYTLEVWPWMNFVARAPDANRLLPNVQRAVRGVEPALEFLGRPSVLRTGAAAVEPQRRFLTLVLSGFAAGALLLAAIGLYSIVAYGVMQRTRELGVRIALGAPTGSVLSLVLRDTATFVIGGAALGLLGAFLSTRLIRSMLFDTAPTDVATFVIVPLVLAVVAIAASYMPARRATKVDPMIAIRAE
jgi:putative ABC transport system permease protein